MTLYKNKYRIESARAQWWDYGSNGSYFITGCTKNRQHHFGQIKNGIMNITPLGAIVYLLWYEIPFRNPQVQLGEFVVMPNHFHGILTLDNSAAAETLHATSQRPIDPPTRPKNEKMAAISPKSGTVSVILGSFKSAVTKYANRLGLVNGWQGRFHDHIIRDEAEYQRISYYIRNNPKNWKDDTLHTGD